MRRAPFSPSLQNPVVGRPEKLALFGSKEFLCRSTSPETSVQALPYAAALAEQFAAEIVLLHVIEPLPLPADSGYLPSGSRVKIKMPRKTTCFASPTKSSLAISPPEFSCGAASLLGNHTHGHKSGGGHDRLDHSWLHRPDARTARKHCRTCRPSRGLPRPGRARTGARWPQRNAPQKKGQLNPNEHMKAKTTSTARRQHSVSRRAGTRSRASTPGAVTPRRILVPVDFSLAFHPRPAVRALLRQAIQRPNHLHSCRRSLSNRLSPWVQISAGRPIAWLLEQSGDRLRQVASAISPAPAEESRSRW